MARPMPVPPTAANLPDLTALAARVDGVADAVAAAVLRDIVCAVAALTAAARESEAATERVRRWLARLLPFRTLNDVKDFIAEFHPTPTEEQAIHRRFKAESWSSEPREREFRDYVRDRDYGPRDYGRDPPRELRDFPRDFRPRELVREAPPREFYHRDYPEPPDRRFPDGRPPRRATPLETAAPKARFEPPRFVKERPSLSPSPQTPPALVPAPSRSQPLQETEPVRPTLNLNASFQRRKPTRQPLSVPPMLMLDAHFTPHRRSPKSPAPTPAATPAPAPIPAPAPATPPDLTAFFAELSASPEVSYFGQTYRMASVNPKLNALRDHLASPNAPILLLQEKKNVFGVLFFGEMRYAFTVRNLFDLQPTVFAALEPVTPPFHVEDGVLVVPHLFRLQGLMLSFDPNFSAHFRDRTTVGSTVFVGDVDGECRLDKVMCVFLKG